MDWFLHDMDLRHERVNANWVKGVTYQKIPGTWWVRSSPPEVGKQHYWNQTST